MWKIIRRHKNVLWLQHDLLTELVIKQRQFSATCLLLALYTIIEKLKVKETVCKLGDIDVLDKVV